MTSLSSEERHEMGMRARQVAKERYSLNAVVDMWLELYADCARKGRA